MVSRDQMIQTAHLHLFKGYNAINVTEKYPDKAFNIYNFFQSVLHRI